MREDEIREAVRSRYAAAATSFSSGTRTGASCCAPETVLADEEVMAFGAGLYGEGEQGELPDTATMASLGCGNPTAVADLGAGETVLDLGSGGGIDVLLSASRVGPLTRREFEESLVVAGLEDVEITETHRVHDKAASAIIRARKPAPQPT